MAQLQDKVALVTGAASGLGLAIAQRFAEEGARVVLADIDTMQGEAEARALGDSGHFIALNVTKNDDWETAISDVTRRFGRLDILVNNAGITNMGNIEELSLDAWQQMLDIDLTGVFLGCKHAIAAMKQSGGGSIVNMSSASGLRASANLAGYNAAKAGVTLMTKSVALHCAAQKYNIRCNSVHPGAIHTPILDKVMAQVPDPKALMDGFIAQHPIGHLGEPSDIATIVLYLASDASKFATGAEFIVDGGLTL